MREWDEEWEIIEPENHRIRGIENGRRKGASELYNEKKERIEGKKS